MIATSNAPERQTKPAVTQNLRSEIFWLYVLQGTTGFLPLLLIHHAGRIVGPTEWGRLALAEAIGRYLQVIIEYGFQVSGARDAAGAAGNPERLGHLVCNILSAQLVLALACLAPAILLGTYLGLGTASTLLIGSAILWGTAQAMTLSWFFQAIGQIRRFASIDMCFRALAVALVFLLVSRPEHAWRVLGIQAICSALTLIFSFTLLSGKIVLERPQWSTIGSTIREGFALFSFRAAGMLYISLNVVILKFYVSTEQVGIFAAAERLCRISLYALAPLNSAFYVRIARYKEVNAPAALLLSKRATGFVGLAGIAVGTFLILFGATVCKFLFGPQFAASGELTRWFGVVVMIAMLNTIIGSAWLLPRRKDRTLSVASIAAGITNIVLASLLAPRFGPTGMVFSLIVCELVVLAFYHRQMLTAGARLRSCLRPCFDFVHP
jgi:polysaccharide transporter, PST family